MRNKAIIVCLILLSFCAKLYAQTGIDTVLSNISRNNKTLAATVQFFQAENLRYQTGNTLYDPTAELDFLSGRQANTGKQIDFTLSQSFDFPSVYIKKNQLAGQKIIQSEYKLTAKRQDILLEAKKVCISLTYHYKLQTRLSERKIAVEKVLADFKSRLNNGEGNILDLNKARLQLIEIRSDFQENISSINQLNQKLTELNGGLEIQFSDTVYPILPAIPAFEQLEREYERVDPLLKIIEQEKLIVQKEIELSKAMRLPKAELGYHYQGILGQTYNGIHSGITIPLCENKNKTKQKKAQLLFTDLELLAHVNEHYFHIRHIYEKYANLKVILEEYNTFFSSVNNTALLNKSLASGQISTIEFFMEMSYFNNAYNNFLRSEKEYYEVVAELYKFRL